MAKAIRRILKFMYPWAKLEVFRGDNRQWYFRKVARNGRILTVSEGYHNFEDAVRLADYEPRWYKVHIQK